MHTREKIGETLRALVVLALFFLNFAHVPPTAAPADAFMPLSVAGICGDPLGEHTHHALPRLPHRRRRRPAAALPAGAPAFAATMVDYVAVAAPTVLAQPRLTTEARAPPAA